MANIKTINQLITVFQDAANRHYQINGFGYGDNWEIGASEAKIHPVLWINPVSAVMTESENNIGYKTFEIDFEIRIFDLVNKDESNENEVLSDSIDILKDIITEFKGHPYYTNSQLNIVNDIDFEPFTEEFDEEVTGWVCELSFKTPLINSWCGLPMAEIEGFSFPGADCDGYNAVCDATYVEDVIGVYPIEVTQVSGNTKVISIDTSSLTGDTFTTDATLSGNVITFDRNDINDAYSVDLSSALSGFVTDDIYVTGGTFNNISNNLELVRNDDNAILIDLSQLKDDTNSYTTGTTVIGNVIYYDRNDSLSAYTTDLTSILTGVTLTADNGLNVQPGNIVELGGELNKDTTISGDTNNLTLGTSNSPINGFDVNAITSTQTFTTSGFGSIENVYTPNGLTTTTTDVTGNVTNILNINPTQTKFDVTDTSTNLYTFIDVNNNQFQGSSSNTSTGENSNFTVAPNQTTFTHNDGGVVNNNIYLTDNNVLISHTSGATTNAIVINESSLVIDGPNTNLTFGVTGTTFTDSRAITKGIEYAADYSAGWTDNSLITKKYVDDALTGATDTNFANTDLTLTGARTHDLGANTLTLDGTSSSATFTYQGNNLGGIAANWEGRTAFKANYSSPAANIIEVQNLAGTRIFEVRQGSQINLDSSGAGNVVIGSDTYVGSSKLLVIGGARVQGTDTLPTSTAFEVYDGDTTPSKIFDLRNNGDSYHYGTLSVEKDVLTSGGESILQLKTQYSATSGGSKIEFINNANGYVRSLIESVGFEANNVPLNFYIGSGAVNPTKRLTLERDGVQIGVDTTGPIGSEFVSLQGNTLVKGSNTSSATTGFEVVDSSNSTLFDVKNNADVFTYGVLSVEKNVTTLGGESLLQLKSGYSATSGGSKIEFVNAANGYVRSQISSEGFEANNVSLNFYIGDGTTTPAQRLKLERDGIQIGISPTAPIGNEVISLQGRTAIKGADTLPTSTAFEIYDGDTTPNQLWDFRNNGDIYSTLIDLVSTGEISIGSSALGFGTGISIGTNAGTAQTGAAINNTFVGKDSGLSTTSGQHNTALGKDSFRLGTTGTYNIAIGVDVMSNAAVTGNHNVAVGFSSMDDVTSGSENTGFGQYAGSNITTGGQNTCIGSFAGSTGLLTGSRNVFLGYSAGRRETGSDKFFVDNRVRTDEATARIESLLYGEMAAAISSQRLTINGRGRLQPMSAANAAVLTASDGDMVYVNTTDATFTSVGFWGREAGAWVKL